jgi:5-methyltetrahydropteroyltriglutamate--homocysteine methyltransferase
MTIRGDVVGSLLRPAYLVEARTAREAGRLAPAEFKRVEDGAVDEAVALQEAAGLDVVSDGELRRYAFFGHLVDAVDGFDKFGGWAIPFRDEEGGELIFKRPVVVEKLRWRHSMCAEEFVYLRARVRRPETIDGQDQLTATGRQGSRSSRSMVPKATLISTQQAAAYYDPKRSAGAYPTRDAYLADVVDLTRREIDELVRLGCTYVQVDAPQYAALLDPTMREGYRKRGSDPDALIDACIEMDNAVIGHHPGVIFGLHICRGNNQSKFYASGDYGPIARVFGKSRFQRFLLEYDDDRSGGFEPLAAMPPDREVVLGLVTTKKPRLESVDELRRRIDEASRYVPFERLAVSPQCGFASTMEGNLISPERQREKLARVAETARLVWGTS